MELQADFLALLRLLTAHLAADFLLQPLSWIEGRRRDGVRSKYLYYHIAIVGLLTWLFLWDWSEILLPLFIMVTHYGIDLWKASQPRRLKNFVIDQSGHLLVILVGWIIYSGTYPDAVNFLEGVFNNSYFWVILISYLVAIWPCGYLIAQITERWQKELTAGPGGEDYSGLKNAGMWIGWVERFIILTFILLNQYSGIGFLIAAKSVFRFSGKLEGGRERKEAEYILIGTLLSFALSITIGIGAVYLEKV